MPATAIVCHEGAHWVFARTASGFTALPVTVISSADGFTRVRPQALTPQTRIAVSGTAALKGALLGIGWEEGP